MRDPTPRQADHGQRAASVMGRAYRRCKVPLVSAPLDLAGDVVDLLRALIDIESVSGNEAEIADRVEEALAAARPPDGAA